MHTLPGHNNPYVMRLLHEYSRVLLVHTSNQGIIIPV